MTQYAARTQVSVEKSKGEIERTLRRYDADGFMYATQGDSAMVQFTKAGRMIRLVFQQRPIEDFRLTDTGRERSYSVMEKEWEQAGRQVWRAVALWIKAKLEAVESGITTFEDEFLSHTVLPSGQTVSDWLQPQMEYAIEGKLMPKMLELGTGK